MNYCRDCRWFEYSGYGQETYGICYTHISNNVNRNFPSQCNHIDKFLGVEDYMSCDKFTKKCSDHRLVMEFMGKCWHEWGADPEEDKWNCWKCGLSMKDTSDKDLYMNMKPKSPEFQQVIINELKYSKKLESFSDEIFIKIDESDACAIPLEFLFPCGRLYETLVKYIKTHWEEVNPIFER